ncbi:MAG: tagaturonate reductase [Bacillota bacterium]|nr:tagaturonate reductase [Bacillota bacterium]
MDNLRKSLFKVDENKLHNNLIVGPLGKLPIKALQFGEGNFLRGFVDWMFNRLNAMGLFNGSIVVVQPINQGKIDVINDQDGLYTLMLRGIHKGENAKIKELVSAISRGIDIYSDYDNYLKLAESPELRVIVSNTTEAGIAYNPEDKLLDDPPQSFPGKLTVFLYNRFKIFKGDFKKGFIIIPCELIDRNGDNLKEIVLRLASLWNLGEDFIDWVNKGNHFLNTLVDRIITGYPKDEAQAIEAELGYHDNLLVTGEIFHLWVIEGSKELAAELPFTEAGLNVVWTNDLTPYRIRKVRILNGAHTMTSLAAYLYGKETVKECMDDNIISMFMKQGIMDEIIPTLDLPESELKNYAEDVLERFSNPYIKHYLLSISLNSISKFKVRVLPSLLEYINRKNILPQILTFSMAALFAFYRGTKICDGVLIGVRNGMEYKINDDINVLEAFKDLWKAYDGTEEGMGLLVSKLLARTDWWDANLNEIDGLTYLVSKHLFEITAYGMEKALKDITTELNRRGLKDDRSLQCSVN